SHPVVVAFTGDGKIRVVRFAHPVVAGAEARMVVWQSDSLSVVGLTCEVALGTAYVVAARRVRLRRPWPRSASAAFLAGLAALAVVLQSGMAAYDENYAVHVVQHVVLMSIAPLLLAFGAPVTLLLRVARPPSARRVVAVLHSRFARA